MPSLGLLYSGRAHCMCFLHAQVCGLFRFQSNTQLPSYASILSKDQMNTHFHNIHYKQNAVLHYLNF